MALIMKHGSTGALVESFSVTVESCELAGAWEFDQIDDEDFANVISDKLLITPNSNLALFVDENKYNSKYVSLDELKSEAVSEAKVANEIFGQYIEDNHKNYAAYMKVPPAERKLLPKVKKLKLEPFYFNEWDMKIDHISPGSTLNLMKKRSVILGTPEEMMTLNQFTWLIKTLIEMWLQDEKERNARQRIDKSFENFRVLPESWLQEFLEIRASI